MAGVVLLAAALSWPALHSQPPAKTVAKNAKVVYFPSEPVPPPKAANPAPAVTAAPPKSQNTASNQPTGAKPIGLALGDNLPWMNQSQLNSQLNSIARLGIRWIRIDVSWADVQPSNASQYDWNGLDRVVAAANRRGLKILGTLAYTPKWAGLPICSPSQLCAPANNSQFAAFSAAAAKRYAPLGLRSWEIWNEPNLGGFWKPAPSPTDYTALLQAAYIAIKQADAGATVMTGGLGPLDNSQLSINQQTFLSAMYQNGAKNYFNAVGYHPYSLPALPSTIVSWSGWSTMNDLPISIRSIMAANGDNTKQIWITEFGAPTNGLTSVDHVDEAIQSSMLSDAAAQYKADPWLASFFWYTYQDLGSNPSDNNNFYGLLRLDGSPKPAYAAMQNAIGN